MNDQQNLFKVRVKDIVTDSENPSICWIDLEIYYNPPNTTKTFCIQRGSLCSNQIYRFQDERYIIGFDISPYVDEEGYLS